MIVTVHPSLPHHRNRGDEFEPVLRCRTSRVLCHQQRFRTSSVSQEEKREENGRYEGVAPPRETDWKKDWIGWSRRCKSSERARHERREDGGTTDDGIRPGFVSTARVCILDWDHEVLTNEGSYEHDSGDTR